MVGQVELNVRRVSLADLGQGPGTSASSPDIDHRRNQCLLSAKLTSTHICIGHSCLLPSRTPDVWK